MTSWPTRIAAILIALCFGMVPAYGQEARGTITGTLKDAQGGALPGVTVTALHVATNVTTTATSNESGTYLLSALQIGAYRLTFTLPGFTAPVRELEVRAGDRLQVDQALVVGAITEQVQVVADTPLLQTTTASRSTVIDQEKVQNLRCPAAIRSRSRRSRPAWSGNPETVRASSCDPSTTAGWITCPLTAAACDRMNFCSTGRQTPTTKAVAATRCRSCLRPMWSRDPDSDQYL